MPAEYSFFLDLVEELPEIPSDSIISRTIFSNDQVKVVLFGFAPKQELSEHTASMPAILYFVTGEAHLTLGTDPMEAKAGTLVHMPANLSHSILAKIPTTMLLLLLRSTD